MDEGWDEDDALEDVDDDDGGGGHDSKRDPDRIFCPKCTNMWGPWEDRQRKLLMLKCASCGHMERADNSKPVHENFVVKRLQNILDNISPYTGDDPTLHQHTRKCDKCDHDEVVHFQADAGAKAESLKLAFVCKGCGHKWLTGKDDMARHTAAAEASAGRGP